MSGHYSADFWVAVATAAPVVALAAIVTVRDTWDPRVWSKPRPDRLVMDTATKPTPGRFPYQVRPALTIGFDVGRFLLKLAYWVAAAIVTVEGIILLGSLEALRSGSNSFSPVLAELVTFACILALVAATLLQVRGRTIYCAADRVPLPGGLMHDADR